MVPVFGVLPQIDIAPRLPSYKPHHNCHLVGSDSSPENEEWPTLLLLLLPLRARLALHVHNILEHVDYPQRHTMSGQFHARGGHRSGLRMGIRSVWYKI